MHASEWIAIIMPSATLLLAGGLAAWKASVKIAVSLDRIGESLKSALDKLSDHEDRLRAGGL